MENRCLDAFGGGVYLNFWGMSIKNEVFCGNRVTGNRAASPEDNGGIYLNGSMIFEYNRIHDNRGSQLYNANLASRPPPVCASLLLGNKKGRRDPGRDPRRIGRSCPCPRYFQAFCSHSRKGCSPLVVTNLNFH